MSQRKRMLRHGPRTGVLAASIGALVASGGISSIALGQDNDDDDRNTSGADTIVVTGTRIRQNDFSANVPTTVITGQEMQDLGVVSVADMVNQLPSNIASVSPEATADSPFYLGASIANMRGLNTAFGVRTLTLIDSRRVTPTNNAGGVDMNFIPSALVGRIETVTGGASAAYGADAMAGVVNVILDDNVDNIRIDLNYQTSDDPGGDQYTFSFGTGAQFFENGRGRLTVGLDSSRQDAVEDCLTRDVCQQGIGLFRNGVQTPATFSMYSPRGDSIVFQGEPEWMFQRGQRYTTTPEGVVFPRTTDALGYPCAVLVGDDPLGESYDLSACNVGTLAQIEDNYERGWYRLNEAGTDLVPYFTPEQVTEDELRGVDTLGAQAGTGLDQVSLQGAGNQWSTPWGLGRSIYAEVPINPETNRDNLFARFSYELEGGIRLTTDIRYGVTESTSFQNASRNNLQAFCLMPWNAYLQEEAGAGELLRNVYQARAASGFTDDGLGGFFVPFSFTPNPEVSNTGCSQAPFLGGSFNQRDDEIDSAKFEFAPGLEFAKDFSTSVDRFNRNKSNSLNWSISATGSLFDGGSWTWDAYAQLGSSENRQSLSSWRAARRWDMALDSVIDGYDTNGDGVIDTQDPSAAGAEPVIVCTVNAVNAEGVDADGNPINYGDWMRQRWADYIYQAESDTVPADQLAGIFETFREGCTPVNPFGNRQLTDAERNYTFPRLFEGTDNDQESISISFSGDAWRGIGNAGPMQMAAGIDWRVNDTQNLSDSNRYLGADFNFIGTSRNQGANSNNANFQRIYGDNWFGRSTTKEAFVEFDLPLLRDKPGADYLAFSTAFRRTESTSDRISGIEGVDARSSTRTVDTWRASMQWQPVDLLRIRANRSVDTRAPSANELFATNSFATETGGALEIRNPFRFSYPGNADTEDGDQITVLQAGNPVLATERSVTETLGVVFQPVEALPGLQVSVDYLQTTIEGGIRDLGYRDVVSACFNEIAGPVGEEGAGRWGNVPYVPEVDWKYCNSIQFEPDPDQEFYIDGAQELPWGGFTATDILGPDGETEVVAGTANAWYPYTNIISVAESSINEEDFVSRSIDYSITYSTQLSGGGSLTARGLLTRYLEQGVLLDQTFGPMNVAGQTGSNNIANYLGSFSVNYSPVPRIRGNLQMTYRKNAFSMTAQARYTGTGKLSIQNGWLGPNDAIGFTPYFNGDVFGDPEYWTYDPDLERTIQNADLPSWTTLNVNFNYDLGRSRMQLDRFESLSVYLNIDNIGDRVPDFFSGTGAGGINTALFSAWGRQYRMGVRMEF